MNHNFSKVVVFCSWCYGGYWVFPNRIKRTKYCSRKCHNTAISHSPKKGTGTGKNNRGKKRPDLVKYNQTHINRGEKNPRWKGGISSINSIIRGRKETKEWIKYILKRDDYTCQLCSKRGGDMEAHHIKTFSKFPELRHDINNGITLCKKCHRLTFWRESQFENIFYAKLNRELSPTHKTSS